MDSSKFKGFLKNHTQRALLFGRMHFFLAGTGLVGCGCSSRSQPNFSKPTYQSSCNKQQENHSRKLYKHVAELMAKPKKTTPRQQSARVRRKSRDVPQEKRARPPRHLRQEGLEGRVFSHLSHVSHTHTHSCRPHLRSTQRSKRPCAMGR